MFGNKKIEEAARLDDKEYYDRLSDYILANILGIELLTKDDFEDLEEYQEQNQEYTSVVNDWLIGKIDDTAIMEFAWDCSDDAIGIFNLIAIISYLKKRNVIE